MAVAACHDTGWRRGSACIRETSLMAFISTPPLLFGLPYVCSAEFCPRILQRVVTTIFEGSGATLQTVQWGCTWLHLARGIYPIYPWQWCCGGQGMTPLPPRLLISNTIRSSSQLLYSQDLIPVGHYCYWLYVYRISRLIVWFSRILYYSIFTRYHRPILLQHLTTYGSYLHGPAAIAHFQIYRNSAPLINEPCFTTWATLFYFRIFIYAR